MSGNWICDVCGKTLPSTTRHEHRATSYNVPFLYEEIGLGEPLLEAVRNLYYAAYWKADRPCDEAKLWEDVRDAAGFPKGSSPKSVSHEYSGPTHACLGPGCPGEEHRVPTDEHKEIG